MNQLLFDREAGTLSPKAFARSQSTKALNSLQLSDTQFDGGEVRSSLNLDEDQLYEEPSNDESTWASRAGVNALAIDKFESKLMISGGADGSIRLWNLENRDELARSNIYKPQAALSRRSSAHQFGITELSFYPFDSAAFLSSSYDHFLKLFSTDTLTVSASFDLDSVVYNHALSPIASHLLVACATQHTIVRLVDLKSGSTAHSLAGHESALLSVSWSPIKEHVLATGDTSGTVRLWDIRSSAATLGVLDLEDSIGITGYDNLGLGMRTRHSGKAHTGAVNGITWTDDGNYLLTAGHDQRLRVWDMVNGRNTLASFGPNLKNNHLSTLSLLIAPTALTPAGQNTLFYPNGQEILQFDLHEGRLQKRLKVPSCTSDSENITRKRTTAMAWRVTDNELYSAHSDGQIRAWLPRTAEDDIEDEEEKPTGNLDDGDESRKRKRQALDEVFRDLTKKKITFT